MSMNREALELIQATAITATQPEILGTTDIPVVALPNDMKIHSLETYLPQPCRYRGAFKTRLVDSFVGYVTEHQGGIAFIDPEDIRAKAYFDLGDVENPGHGEHQAILNLHTTVPYQAIAAIDGRQQKQKSIAEWMEDWREYLTAYNAAGDETDIKKAIAAVRNLTIEASRKENHQDSDLRASRSAMEEIEAKSEHGLPARLIFTCKPYEDLKHRDFLLRLSINTGEGTPQFTLRIAQLDAIREEIAEEFKDLLSDKLVGVSLHIGSFTK